MSDLTARVLVGSMRLGCLVVAGALAMGVTGCAHTGTPRPAPAAASVPQPSRASVPAPPASPAPSPPVLLGRSEPVRLAVARLGIATDLLHLGQNPDGTLATPPLARAQLAAWYDLGPTPGERGPAVFNGHVDTHAGPAVFYRLGEARRGDIITVERADGSIATFRVDAVESVSKDRFPTEKVYNPTGDSQIRLITCGGRFDRASGHYENNIIVYGHLIRPR